MKKVFKFVKGKKDDRKESGGIAPSQSGDLVSPAQTPEDEGFLGSDNSSGYDVDFGGKDKTLTKLHKAAWQGNLEKLKSALKKVEVDAVDRRNRTALHFAVAQGHPNIVWFLLGNNAKTSVSDDDGHTPLLKAIECGHKDCMTLLLDRGADVNASDYSGNTGLHVAVDRSSLDTASALLKKGADTEVSNNAGDYPLHIATKLENKDLVDLLLDGGASVDVPDRENRTPLMLAAKTGNCLLARIFVEHGAQLTVVDSNGWTAQDYAMLGGHENVSSSLKSFSKRSEKKTGQENEKSDSSPKVDVPSRGDERKESGEEEPANRRFGGVVEKFSEDESVSAEKEKSEDFSESPGAEAIPPYCQPPRSWEMIQAGMIDENKNRIEGKRRSLTALGTLHSRRESFAEGSAAPSPQFTLSLNRRKCAKGNNSFAKQRFSFNEEESLKYLANGEKAIQGIGVENTMTLGEAGDPGAGPPVSESDWDSASEEKSRTSDEVLRPGSGDADCVGSNKSGSNSSESGTLGRIGTMREVEEIWVGCPRPGLPLEAGEDQINSWDSEYASSGKEGSFPPPPTALELGIDMAKSIKYMKGMSVDRPPGCSVDRNLWRNVHDRRSLDRLEERDFLDISKANAARAHAKSASAQRGEETLKCQKPTDKFTNVNKRINEELECYDQALRELAESARTSETFPSQNYHSLPSMRSGGAGECRRASSQELASDASCRPPRGGPHSLPFFSRRRDSERDEGPAPALPPERSPEGIACGRPGEKLEKKTKRYMLLAMRDVKHAVHVANSFKTSMDDQILSPLTKPEDGFDSGDETSPKGLSASSGGNSPPDENPFFGMGRQETVLERNGTGRKSSSSGTGEESTLWLQDDARRKGLRCPDSDDDVSEIAADDGPKHRRVSSFSPLGVIQKEMEEESRENKSSAYNERNLSAGERSPLPCEGPIGGEREDQHEEFLREQSPDVSLSSGPIEPIGAEKDSGSDPESSHNDASPTHNYALKSQHEWLKCHLKAATSEKNKLEELSAQLAEKAERLQYELADAKEAAKSRDEVIRLLQGQLARMEAAYTKSLEESVQSRLQLTSHEQEILHLKEVCFRYEEDKEAAGAGVGGDFLQELKLRVKILEGEKEKMREEISQLEEEKCLLEKRLKQGKNEESGMIEECQRWKERCRKLEEIAKARECEEAAGESSVTGKDREHRRQEDLTKQQNFHLEKKFLELNEENAVLKTRIQGLAAELETERKKTSVLNEKDESLSEMKKKNLEMEIQLQKLEKETEERIVKKLREKEEEVEGLVKQFNRERDSLVASYEKKLSEGRSGQSDPDADEWKRGNERLKHVVESLQDQMVLDRMRMNASVEDAQAALKKELSRLKDEWNAVSNSIAETRKHPPEFNALAIENIKLCREINDLRGKMSKGEGEGEDGSRGLWSAGVKSEFLDLRAQINSFRMLLDGERWPSMATEDQKNSEKPDGKRRGVGKEDELAWSSLYGMTATRRRRSGRSISVSETPIENDDAEDVDETKRRKPSGENARNRLKATPEPEGETSQKFQKLEFLELKKEILSLQSKMLDEKNLRHALENQMIKMNLDLTKKDNLEKEINSLKRKVDRDCLRRSEMELLEYQKDLEATREKYLGGSEGRSANDDYKAKCEILAKEREKSKEIGKSPGRRTRSFDRPPPEAPSHPKFHSCPRPLPELFLQPRSMALDPGIKNKLERELDKSIEKYVRGEPKRQF